VIPPEERHAKWLGGAEDGDLTGRMKMWPISSQVNSPENSDEAITMPTAAFSPASEGNDNGCFRGEKASEVSNPYESLHGQADGRISGFGD
jgi:hypothetical protein